MTTTLSERISSAQRKYRCIWCGEHIEQGSDYVRKVLVFEGDFQRHRYHPECHAAMNTVSGAEWNDWDNFFEEHEFKRGTKEPKHQ